MGAMSRRRLEDKIKKQSEVEQLKVMQHGPFMDWHPRLPCQRHAVLFKSISP